MLIVTNRHRADDLERWRMYERIDALNARRLGAKIDRAVGAAMFVMRDFIAAGGGYLGVSWGKDSVICAWLLACLEADEGITYPVVWVRVRRFENPDCVLVRDAFLARWQLSRYVEIEVDAGANRDGGTSAPGFAEAARRFGDRHVSGVRGAESRARAIAVARWGTETTCTCRPIARWSAEDVFATLHAYDLPAHPAYGYTMGGIYDREHLRVGSLGGGRGTGHGRAEWERAYYGEALRAAADTPRT